MKISGLLITIASIAWTFGATGCVPDPEEGKNPESKNPESMGRGADGSKASDDDGKNESLAGIVPASARGVGSSPSEAVGSKLKSRRDLKPLVPQGRQGDPVSKPGSKLTSSGVEYAVLQEGVGPQPKAGASVQLHLTGWLRNGPVLGPSFWNSRDDGVTHGYKLTEQDLIKGLVETLGQMKTGERRWVVVPASMGYGDVGYAGVVPPRRDLVLDVQLASFVDP